MTLDGRRIVVTRAAEQAGSLVDGLVARVAWRLGINAKGLQPALSRVGN